MTKTTKNGKSLVIVESPAKAKTIRKFLGADYEVEASIGHIRDLPKGSKELPETLKKEKWARFGVNVDSAFEPVYVISPDKAKQIKKLKDLLKDSDALYLATDEDREGEAISWHLFDVLKPKVPVHRLVFHEITRTAILDALNHPRQIDEDLVHAQETRRIIDRLYGYEVSPLLWRKIKASLSAGRVQSVAVRLIVERERERMAFKNATYFDILGNFVRRSENSSKHSSEKPFDATLISVGKLLIPTGKDFDPKTGRLNKPDKFLLLDEEQARKLLNELIHQPATVHSIEEKPYTTRPYAPFTTSTLQQEANRKLGFTARTTMNVAQSLYENGYITYMRTDSTTLSQEAIRAARALIQMHYGSQFLPDSPRYYQTKVKNAQEAHEAIRPAGNQFVLPDSLKNQLSPDEFKLYNLIWKRTVASQMKDAIGKHKTIQIAMDNALFHVSGKTIEFPGYLRAYVEGKDDPNAELADQEIILPDVVQGEMLDCRALTPNSHTTMPPVRFSEAALTRMLEEKGIGRPSTYASIIETILNRNYVFKKSGALVPTWTAFAVSQLLEAHLPNLVDYQFTAQMEDHLDQISRGETGFLDYLRMFYFGDELPESVRKKMESEQKINLKHKDEGSGKNSSVKQDVTLNFDSNVHRGLKSQIENKVDEIDAREVCSVLIGTPIAQDGSQEEPIVVRIGRYGPFLQQGEKQTGIPEDIPPDEITLSKAQEMLAMKKETEAPLGICPQTGLPIYIKTGRFGPYVQRGDNPEDPKKGEKPQFVSLLKGMSPAEIDLETALALLSLPRTLGVNEENGEEVVASNGRFGPYIKCGSETRSIPSDISVLEINLDQALELLSKPKQSSRRGAVKKAVEPLIKFDNSPITGNPVQLLTGRYGPYLSDGETNVSLPKDVSQEQLTFETALSLLADKAAKAPTKKKRNAKKTTKKTAVKKSAKTTKTVKTPAKKTTKSVKKSSVNDTPEDETEKTPVKKTPTKKTGVKKTVKKTAVKKTTKKTD